MRLEFARAFFHERFGKSERKTYVARGGARAVCNEGADERHVARTEAFQHRVDHLVTSIGGEVHIHIRIRLASFIEEALEDQVVTNGIYARDAEEIRNDRITRTPTTLCGDPIHMRLAHDLCAEQEELGEPRAFDGGELARNAPLQLCPALWVAAWYPGAHLARKLLVGAHASGEVDPRKADARKVQVNVRLCRNHTRVRKCGTPRRMCGEQFSPSAQVRLRLWEAERT